MSEAASNLQLAELRGHFSASTLERAGVPLVHYDQDYERIAAVTRQPDLRCVAHGALAEKR